jgi:hypothetical protein
MARMPPQCFCIGASTGRTLRVEIDAWVEAGLTVA